MSNTGLHSGLYQTLHSTATLVDDVLVTLSTQNRCNTDACAKLGQLLLDLGAEDSKNLSIRILALAIRDRQKLTPSSRREAGEALLSSQADQQTLEVLEELARALEQMQVQTLARMREGSP
jgi:hypothetical protein